MAAKAQWIRTTYGKGYDAGWIYRTYEYRGRKYITAENRKSGNAMGEALWQQHKKEQQRIDREIDNPEPVPTPEEVEEISRQQEEQWDAIWEMLGWND